MGLCQSEPNYDFSPDADKNKAISKGVDEKLKQDNLKKQGINKLLLLGAGGSGKSTLFKQMTVLYGSGFPESDRQNFIPIIYTNIIGSMKVLCVESEKHGGLTDLRKDDKQKMMGMRDEEKINVTVGKLIQRLWLDEGIKKTFANRYNFELKESAKFFFDNLDRIMEPNYVPSGEDMLRARISTTGIVEQTFLMDTNVFKMFDVGGQRSERKKWIHCFENVTAVLFVAAISAYDQNLFEDDTKNRMLEALELFEEIANSEWFENTSMILFLNKKDIFAEKIKVVPLEKFFPNYEGVPGDEEEAKEFITEMFQERNHNDQIIYVHVTCATDTSNVKQVFIAVKDIVIRKGLANAGLC